MLRKNITAMKNLLYLISLSLLGLCACNETKQANCVESDYYKLRGDSCVIIEGDTADHLRAYTHHTFTKITDNLSCCADQIKVLYLDSSQIKQASLKELLKFNNLKELLVTGFHTLPKEIEHLKNLETIHINYDGNFTLPEEIKNLKNLKKIKLVTHNFPTNVFKIPHLQSLTIISTQATFPLPQDLSRLKKLKKLVLRDFQTFPKQIITLKNLEVLSFEPSIPVNDQFKTKFIVPNEISQLSHLKTLSFSGLKLDTLPNSIYLLKKLQFLDLPLLKVLPKSFVALSNLKSIRLSRTDKYPLKNVAFFLTGLKTLNKLDISQNGKFNLDSLAASFTQLKQLDTLVFRGDFSYLPSKLFKRSLKYLYIQNHPKRKLKTFPKGILTLKQLTHLTIAYTGITKIPPEISQLKKLKTLHLHHQKLRDLPNSIQNLNNLQDLSIHDNPLDYNKAIEKFRKLLPNTHIN